MAYIVIDNCTDCMFTDCVTVCPVNCFYGSANMMYIHPDECIDCGACVPECPVEAIFAEADVPEDKTEWTAKNADVKDLEADLNARSRAVQRHARRVLPHDVVLGLDDERRHGPTQNTTVHRGR